MIEHHVVYLLVDPKQCSSDQYPAGTRFVRCPRWDYGCANEDSHLTGVEHVSIVPVDDKEAPWITCPVSNLTKE